MPRIDMSAHLIGVLIGIGVVVFFTDATLLSGVAVLAGVLIAMLIYAGIKHYKTREATSDA